MIDYALPYTAPDGTPRRPLIERVEEIVPVRDERVVNINTGVSVPLTLTRTRNHWHWRTPKGAVFPGGYVTDDDAADLIRVRLDSWARKTLRESACNKTLKLHQFDPIESEVYRLLTWADTHADANAAGHALADATGRAH